MTRAITCDTVCIVRKLTVLLPTEIYEPKDACRLIGIGYATLYRWIKAGKLTPIRIAGRTLIPKSEIERLKNEKAATGIEGGEI